ncbi:MAG: type 1 glutamine amidotransferase [Thermoplasmata archaeon]|nr:type 1 glutamine amidotransferase [Thermoplasmata archaeon]
MPVDDFFDEKEFIYPYYRILEAGHQVIVGGREKTTYSSKAGVVVQVDKTFAELSSEDVDAIFIPGGYAPDRVRRDENALRIVRELVERGAPVGAVCHGPWLLLSAGVLKGRRVTSFFSIRAEVEAAGASWTGNRVEVDGNLVTGTDPSSLPELLPRFLALLEGMR